MKEIFNEVLDKDEQIIKVFKPNKRRSITLKLIFFGLFLIPLAVIFLILSILIFNGTFNMVDDTGVDGTIGVGILTICLAVFFFLIFGLSVVIQTISYKKTFYAFSNKRILMRSGFIGVDYLTLEMKLIGAIAINVGFLDKFIKPNTGSIRFGSNSTPMGVTQQNASLGPSFKYIENAYETYREIKEVVDQHVR